MPAEPAYPFFAQLARTLNSGQSRSVLLYGDVHDLFFDGGDYVPLVPFLTKKCAVEGIVQLVYELNGPIRTVPAEAADGLRSAWVAWKSGADPNQLVLEALVDRRKARQREALEAEFDALVHEATGSPTVALEFLRQLTVCSRGRDAAGRPLIGKRLLIFIEEADLLLPGGDEPIGRLNAADRHRLTILRDWFSDPAFQDAADSVVLLSESRGAIHRLITSLPQMLSVEVPAPTAGEREQFIRHFVASRENGPAIGERKPVPKFWTDVPEVARFTAGLSLHALRQLLLGAAHADEPLSPRHVIGKVESYISSQLGEDVVEFKMPGHTLADVVGFTKLKDFLRDELMPRMRSSGADALPGAAVAGPIGGGKTFIFEAVAAELNVPVLTLKNIRSQWYGQTDVLFERLRRVLYSLGRVVIFVDEADTQFGGVGAETHETERRLTGKIQQMMSDPALRGKVTWLLMTARIHLLSPDIRRPGRVGDLIIPVLDPEGDDRREFLRWMIADVMDPAADDVEAAAKELETEVHVESAAGFTSLRSNLKARVAAWGRKLSPTDVRAIAADFIPPAIDKTRRYQTLQALINCTRRSLLPDPTVTPEQREAWQAEARRLEAHGAG